jgi:lysyl-tRNA synthetase class 1
MSPKRKKTELPDALPESAAELTQLQRGFMHALADALPEVTWEGDALQTKIAEIARLTPIDQSLAFRALQRVLPDKAAVSKVGNLLASFDRDFVIRRLRELPVDRAAFWRESAITTADLEKFIEHEHERIESQSSELVVDGRLTVNEFRFEMKDGQRVLKRVLTEGGLLA